MMKPTSRVTSLAAPDSAAELSKNRRRCAFRPGPAAQLAAAAAKEVTS